jgi:hypothetical protein
MHVIFSMLKVPDWGSAIVMKGDCGGWYITQRFHKQRIIVEELTSGPRLNARTVSLCSQSFDGAVNKMHRMEMPKLCASLTQTARVSGSAFVLSGASLV